MSKQPRHSKLHRAIEHAQHASEFGLAAPQALAKDTQTLARAEKVSAWGEAWTALTLRAIQANMNFAQTMWRAWWAPARGAWLPFGPAQFHLPGQLPTLSVKDTVATRHAHASAQVPSKGNTTPLHRRVAPRASQAKTARQH
jgi:hypothetical protein